MLLAARIWHRIYHVPLLLISPVAVLLASAVAITAWWLAAECWLWIPLVLFLAYCWLIGAISLVRGCLWTYDKRIREFFLGNPAIRPIPWYFCIGMDIGAVSTAAGSAQIDAVRTSHHRFMMGVTRSVPDWIKRCRHYGPEFCCVHTVCCVSQQVAVSLEDKLREEFSTSRVGQSALYNALVYDFERHMSNFGCSRKSDGSWTLHAVLPGKPRHNNFRQAQQQQQQQPIVRTAEGMRETVTIRANVKQHHDDDDDDDEEESEMSLEHL